MNTGSEWELIDKRKNYRKQDLQRKHKRVTKQNIKCKNCGNIKKQWKEHCFIEAQQLAGNKIQKKNYEIIKNRQLQRDLRG